MRFTLSLMTFAAIVVGLAACNDGGTAVDSKPMKGADTEASGTPVNAKPCENRSRGACRPHHLDGV